MPPVPTKEELKKRLTRQQWEVTQNKGTEAPFSGKYVKSKESGMYSCMVCGAPLFSSQTKFESGTGWPSFYKPAAGDNVVLRDDFSHGQQRTEVVCKRCGSHLGHVFKDAPDTPTGTRYCINSCALDLKKDKPGRTDK